MINSCFNSAKPQGLLWLVSSLGFLIKKQMTNKMLDKLFEKPFRIIVISIILISVVSFIAGAIIF